MHCNEKKHAKGYIKGYIQGYIQDLQVRILSLNRKRQVSPENIALHLQLLF